MKKEAWAVIVERTCEVWDDQFSTKKEAEESAAHEWAIMSEHDRKRTVSFYVGKFEVDEDGCTGDLIEYGTIFK